MSEVATTNVPARVWAFDEDSPTYMENVAVEVDIERTDADEVALHTFIDGRGSEISFYWTREQAAEMAFRLLAASRLR